MNTPTPKCEKHTTIEMTRSISMSFSGAFSPERLMCDVCEIDAQLERLEARREELMTSGGVDPKRIDSIDLAIERTRARRAAKLAGDPEWYKIGMLPRVPKKRATK